MNIKNKKEHYLQQIKYYQDKLKELQNNCAHPNTIEENFSWGLVSSYKAEICEDCGEVIKNLDMPELNNTEDENFNGIVNENFDDLLSK